MKKKENINNSKLEKMNIMKTDYIPPKELIPKKEKKELTELINEVVKSETTKIINNKLSSITEYDLSIAKNMALGDTDEEIKKKHRIEDDRLDYLRGNPAFIAEVQRLTRQVGLGNETTRVSMMSRIGMKIFDSLIGDEDAIMNMSGKDRIDLFIKLNQALDKTQNLDKSINIKTDITLILKERGINQEKIKRDENGNQYVESEFPIIDNETGEIGGKDADLYRNIN